MKRTPLKRRTELRGLGIALKRSPLRKRSQKLSRVAADESLRLAQDEARRVWGWVCMVPGCRRTGIHLHHAHGRNEDASDRDDPCELWPLCKPDHKEAERAGSPLYAALREASGVARAAAAGRRPYLGRDEVEGIIIRHMRAAEEGTRHGSTG